MIVNFSLIWASQASDNTTSCFDNENFYVGKIPNRPISLVMERMTPERIPGWKKYAAVQEDSSTTQAILIKTHGVVNTKDGAGHFNMVLNDVDIRVTGLALN